MTFVGLNAAAAVVANKPPQATCWRAISLRVSSLALSAICALPANAHKSHTLCPLQWSGHATRTRRDCLTCVCALVCACPSLVANALAKLATAAATKQQQHLLLGQLNCAQDASGKTSQQIVASATVELPFPFSFAGPSNNMLFFLCTIALSSSVALAHFFVARTFCLVSQIVFLRVNKSGN